MPIAQHIIDEIKKVYKDGMPVDMIAWKYYTSPQMVKEILSGRYEYNRDRKKPITLTTKNKGQ